MRWKTLLPVALAVATAVPAPVLAQEHSDHLVLSILFCQLRENGAEEPVRYLLTKALLEAIDAAYAKNAEFEKDNPGDKPPLGDGMPFQSFPDWPDSCQPANHQDVAGGALVDIKYSFTKTQGADWTDRIFVIQENGRPLIDDVLYGTDKYRTGLRKVLADIIAGKL